MRKLKILSSIAVFIMILSISITGVLAEGSNIKIDDNMISKGVLNVSYTSSNDSKTKIMIEKDKSKLFFDLNNKGITESLPLQLGSGDYKVSILENTTANKYKAVHSEVIQAKLVSDNSKYLTSIQNIKWDETSEAIKKAKALVNDKMNDEEKLKVIYNYVVANIKYDYSVLNKLPAGYLPDNDSTLKSKKGICYDFSSMFAAMLRSVNVPAKLIMGNTVNVKGYHAWNEVYLKDDNGSGKWIVIDTSYDSQMKETKNKYSMEKSKQSYTKTSEY